ncbi:MAG: hypothetical protein ACKVOE_03510 [Rickettsiales bacterium]
MTPETTASNALHKEATQLENQLYAEFARRIQSLKNAHDHKGMKQVIASCVHNICYGEDRQDEYIKRYALYQKLATANPNTTQQNALTFAVLDRIGELLSLTRDPAAIEAARLNLVRLDEMEAAKREGRRDLHIDKTALEEALRAINPDDYLKAPQLPNAADSAEMMLEIKNALNRMIVRLHDFDPTVKHAFVFLNDELYSTSHLAQPIRSLVNAQLQNIEAEIKFDKLGAVPKQRFQDAVDHAIHNVIDLARQGRPEPHGRRLDPRQAASVKQFFEGIKSSHQERNDPIKCITESEFYGTLSGDKLTLVNRAISTIGASLHIETPELKLGASAATKGGRG